MTLMKRPALAGLFIRSRVEYREPARQLAGELQGEASDLRKMTGLRPGSTINFLANDDTPPFRAGGAIPPAALMPKSSPFGGGASGAVSNRQNIGFMGLLNRITSIPCGTSHALSALRLGRLILFAGLFVLSACFRERISSVARVDLFSLEIGPLDNQVNLSSRGNVISDHRTNLAMRDGLFYISDTFGKKIVRYTSFGDPLFVIYNDLENPPPITLRHGIEEEGVATRWSIAYPLREPGAITVDSRKHIYVVDKVEEERKGFDSEDKTLLDTVVLHFNDSGRFVNFLGQEGIGGKPFPRISGIYASVNDEIAVVCLLSTGWNIYWFNSEGTLLYLVPLQRDSVPVPAGRNVFFSSMDSITAAPDSRKLFLKIDCYFAAGPTSPAVPDSSVIWIMNVENGAYEESMDVPFFEYTTTENNQKVTQRLFYFMLGVIKNDRVFLYFPVDGGYSLLVLTAGSSEQRFGFIQVRNDELEYNAFNLSAEGILSGLVATNWDARFVWWRTDRLLGEMGL